MTMTSNGPPTPTPNNNRHRHGGRHHPSSPTKTRGSLPILSTLQSRSPCGGFIWIFICQIHYSRRACTKSQQIFFCACCRDTSTREW
jgi:hypothetical protein